MNPVRLRCVCVAGRWMALAWLVVMSAGCSLTRPAPVKDMFLLEPPLPGAAAKSHAVSVRMGQVTVAAPYRDRPFVYRTGEVKYESDFYNEFFVTPAAMIAQATGRAVAHANVFARVVPPGNAPDEGEYVLEGFVNELYADARMKPAAAVIAIQYYLVRTGGILDIAGRAITASGWCCGSRPPKRWRGLDEAFVVCSIRWYATLLRQPRAMTFRR